MLGYAIVPLQLIIAKQAIARKGLRGHANGSVNSLRATCPISYFGGADKTNVLSKKKQAKTRTSWITVAFGTSSALKMEESVSYQMICSLLKKKMCNRRSVQVLEIKFE